MVTQSEKNWLNTYFIRVGKIWNLWFIKKISNTEREDYLKMMRTKLEKLREKEYNETHK